MKSNTQFYTVSVRTFVIPFYYGSGSGSATMSSRQSIWSKRQMSPELYYEIAYESNPQRIT